VAFVDRGRGVLTQDALIAQAGDVISGRTLTQPIWTVVNNNDDVVFFSYVEGGPSFANGIFTKDSLIVENGDIIGGQTIRQFFGPPALNDNGVVAFMADLEGLTDAFGVFTPNSLLAMTGDIIGGLVLEQLNDPVLNNAGTVAFSGSFPGGFGIFTKDNVLVRTGDVIGGEMLTFIYAWLSMNDAGAIAYQADYSGGSGIFTLDGVVGKTGDMVEGLKMSRFGAPTMGFVPPSINERGEVAFNVTFEDGRSGIVLAQPITQPIPEPSTWVLFGAGLALISLRRFVKHAR
jgi:hypothetical protein